MCTYDVISRPSCSHKTVLPSICNIKRAAPFPHFLLCEYTERIWTINIKCSHIACYIRAEVAAKQAQRAIAKYRKLQLKYQISTLPLIHLSRRSKLLRRYIKPVPITEPKAVPYKGHYDLELNVLYTIPEVEEPDEIIVGIESDPARWSWNIHEAKAVKITKPVVRKIVVGKPLPPLPNTQRMKKWDHRADPWEFHIAGSTTQLTPVPVPKRVKYIPRPISLPTAIKQQVDEKLTPRCITHAHSVARSQAQEYTITRSSTIEGDASTLPASLCLGLSEERLIAYKAAPEVEEGAGCAVSDESYYALILDDSSYVPLAPRLAVSLSAVGVNYATALAKPLMLVVRALILEVEDAKPPRKLRRVSRMPLAFRNGAGD